jgi:sugar porter (SP) family MFS transporter
MVLTPVKAAIIAAVVNFAGGLMFGFNAGAIPIFLQYYTYTTNCTRYDGEPACDAISGCTWLPPAANNWSGNVSYSPCAFNDRVAPVLRAPCASFNTTDSCKAQSGCFYDTDAGMCQHYAGWTALEQGLVASMLVIGAMIGSPVASPILHKLGRKKTIIACGLVGIFGAVLQTVAWQKDLYALLLVSRCVIGAAVGVGSVASPMYCGELTTRSWQNVSGVFFQISICFGSFVSGIVGVIISPVNDTTDDNHLVARFHLVNAISLLVGLAYLVVGAVSPEPTPELRLSLQAAEDEEKGLLNDEAAMTKELVDEAHDDPATAPKERSLLRAVFVGLALSGVLQLTGINAIMNYAPHLTSRAGMLPFTGNCLIMTWNFIFTIVSIPLARKFEARKMFITAAVIASCACLITGIPAYPGLIANEATQHACVWIGLLLFVAIFEIGVGPPFYPLAQSVFPAKHRSVGCSMCIMTQFTLNCVISFGFPVFVQALSGGASGNQNKGQALIFIIFGSIGLVLAGALAKFM